jgi:hypothetical protein
LLDLEVEMPRSRFASSLVLLFFSSSLFAQQIATTIQTGNVVQSTATSDPQAVGILAKAMAALGSTLPASSEATGTVVRTLGTKTDTGTIKILTLGKSQSVEEIDLPDSVEKTTYAGYVAAMGDGASQQLLPSTIAVVSQTAYFPLALLANAVLSPDSSFQYVGLETAEGISSQHIRVWSTFASKPYLQKFAKYSVRDLWIDSVSNLPRRISFTQSAAIGGPPVVVDIELSNYRNFGGVLYPTLIQKSLNGTPQLAITIESVNFNVGLADALFAINCN